MLKYICFMYAWAVLLALSAPFPCLAQGTTPLRLAFSRDGGLAGPGSGHYLFEVRADTAGGVYLVKALYPNGGPYFEGAYRAVGDTVDWSLLMSPLLHRQAVREGVHRYWYPNGGPREEYSYEGGTSVGRQVTWHENGRVMSLVDGTYVQVWHPNGQPRMAYRLVDGRPADVQLWDGEGKRVE